MVSRNVEHLREEGPSTRDELPNTQVTESDRRNGVWSLDASSVNAVKTAGVSAVYYIRDRHALDQVLLRYFAENPSVEPKSRHAR